MSYFLAPPLVTLRNEINAIWLYRDKTSDGWIGDTSHAARPSDHNPDWSDGGIVRALDIDEDLSIGLAEVGAAMPLVNAIITDPRVRYVIYEGKIWNVDKPWWKPYTGINAHRHHVHVSIRSVGNYDRDGSPWNIAAKLGIGIPSKPQPPSKPKPIPEPEGLIFMKPYVVYANTGSAYYLVTPGSPKPYATRILAMNASLRKLDQIEIGNDTWEAFKNTVKFV